MSPATAVPFRFPQPARANQSGLCLEHHPSPSHNLLRHGDPFHRCLSGILAWRTASRPVHDRQLTDALTGLRHGDPFHRYLSGITAWRSSHLSALRHGDPQLKHFWGRVAWRREGNRYRCRDYVGFATGFSSTPPATGGSEVSPRDEASSKQPQTGLSLLSLSVLGTGTPSTDTSGPSLRGKEGFYRHFGTVTLPTGTSEASQCGEECSYRHFGTATLN